MEPKEWRSLRVGEFAKVVTGGTPSRQVAEYWSGNVPWLSSGEIHQRLITSTRETITEAALHSSNARWIPPRSVLMALNGQGKTRGKVALLAIKATCNQSLAAIICNEEEVLPEYLLQFLESRYREIRGLTGDDGRNGLNLELVRSITVDVPPLTEQRKIVAILSSVDETLEKTQAVIDQLEVVKKGVLGKLLSRGMPGRHHQFVPLPEEWRLGRIGTVSTIPSDWQLVRLTSVARLESGHTPSRKHPEYWNGGVPWVSLHDSKALDVPVISDTAEHISHLGLENSSARLLPAGTVVFSRTATIGKSTILGREMATSQDFANYICGEQLHNRYLMHYFRANQSEWERLKAGSTHKTLYMPIFEQLQILLPPVDEQKAIAQVVDNLEKRISTEQSTLSALKDVKSALLAGLISGRIRVSVPAQEAA